MFVMSNLPVLIIFCPLLGALVCPVISWFNRKAGRWTVTAMAGLSLVLAVLQLRQITEIGRSTTGSATGSRLTASSFP